MISARFYNPPVRISGWIESVDQCGSLRRSAGTGMAVAAYVRDTTGGTRGEGEALSTPQGNTGLVIVSLGV